MLRFRLARPEPGVDLLLDRSATRFLIALCMALSATTVVAQPEADGPVLPSQKAAAGDGGGKLAYQRIARREAAQAGLPYDLVDAVMKIESDYRPDRIGGVGEIGLMQVRPSTAAMMGFRGTASDLAQPAVNIRFGTAYLGAAWRLAKGDVCRTLMKYRAGHGEETMTPLSVTYCQRAREHLASAGSPLAALITPASLVAAAHENPHAEQIDSEIRASESLRIHGRMKRGSAFWAAFETRIHRLNAQVHAKWRRLASR